MKAQDFRARVEQLGDLSQVQRDALVRSRPHRSARQDEAIALAWKARCRVGAGFEVIRGPAEAFLLRSIDGRF